MDRRTKQMGNMTVDLMVGTGWIGMTQSKMEGSWIHMIREAMDMGSTLVLVQRSITFIITIILIG